MTAGGSSLGELRSRLSNWGRWGEEDELGTLNHVTPERRAAAGACVRSGELVSLALPLQERWPQVAGSGRINCTHRMSETGVDAVSARASQGFADDAITMSVHAHTHWDALSHVFDEGRMYNGRSAAEVTDRGAAANDIVPVARTMATRGVLVDLAPDGALAPAHEVTVAELEAALARQRVEIRGGDALLVRTGHLGRIRRAGDWRRFVECEGVNPSEPGIGVACLPWLHEHKVAAVAADNYAVEVLERGATHLPLHAIGIVQMGLLLGEMFDLDGLAASCAAEGRWDFLLAAGPLPIVGAVGGPVNPLAIR